MIIKGTTQDGIYITYDLHNRTMDCKDIITVKDVYINAKEDRRGNNTLRSYDFPMHGQTQHWFEFVNGWTPSKRLIKNMRGAGVDIRNHSGSTVLRRFVSVKSYAEPQSLKDDEKDWDGELLEVFNKDVNFSDYIKLKQPFFAEYPEIMGYIVIPDNFLTQEFIYKDLTPYNYPELFL